MSFAEWVVWLSLGAITYTYAGYPILLRALARVRRPGSRPPADLEDQQLPTVSLIIPVYNEAANIAAKLKNTRDLRYPDDKLELLFVSDGSTDGTVDFLTPRLDARTVLVTLPTRSGKAAALNAALSRAGNEILVFTDAAIALEPDALRKIVRWFVRPEVGCVSGEDYIAGTGGEALYGRYEMFIRRYESDLHSIAGASGCFYAQRRRLCAPFPPGMAPDFLSVLRTVEQGYRAAADPEARGAMAAVRGSGPEFERKVRTLLRGMTALGAHKHLLNPVKYSSFALVLWSHKLMRWLVPAFMILLLAATARLAQSSGIYLVILLVQLAFYALAVAGLSLSLKGLPGIASRIASWFAVTNSAAVVAWIKYAGGVRQELWSPSARPQPGAPAQ